MCVSIGNTGNIDRKHLGIKTNTQNVSCFHALREKKQETSKTGIK